jgi:tetratricopeptide (TPR) repeat protein
VILSLRRNMRSGVVVALAVRLALTACSGGVSNARVAALTEALPATLEPTTTTTTEPRVAKVRVWVDAGARKQPRWREQLLEQIDAASQYWTPLLGIRLEVAAVREWERSAEPSQALQELATLDAGDDVAWVLGYLGPDGTASIAMSELGSAELLGKQVVIHDWSITPEVKKLEAVLEPLAVAERGEAVAAHRRHKQTVVLLHYLHQSAGVIAETDEAWIDSRGYSSSLRTISEKARQLLEVSLKSRLDGEPLGTAAARLIDEIERTEYAGWVATEHESTVAQLRAIVERSKSGKVAQDVPAEALAQVQRAQQLISGGDIEHALAELAPLLIAYPANAALHQLRCDAFLVKPGVASEEAQSACARVSELAPGDPRAELAVARAWNAIGERGKARAALQLATDKAKALPAPAAAFAAVLELYRAMGALTWTEEVLAAMAALGTSAGDAIAVAQSVAGTRARYGVARGATFVAPADEGELVAAIRASLDSVYADKYVEAEQGLAALSKRWPKAPGIAAVRCDLALRREQLAEARRFCALALRADDQQSWAHYLSGILALRGSGTAAGIAHLRRAIEVDPDLGQAWRALGKALWRAGDKAALLRLATGYQAKFGQPLPP